MRQTIKPLTDWQRAIVAEARSWLGTRFAHHGRVKGRSCDCAGLVIGVGAAIGQPVVDEAQYERRPDGAMLLAHCERQGLRVPVAAAQVGDVALFAFKGEPQHLAILGDYFAGGLSMIHAHSLARKVVETRLDESWPMVGVYRFKGID